MLLDAIFGRQRAAAAHGSGDVLQRWLNAGLWGGAKTTAGADVNEEIALTYAAWWCGCRVLAEAVSSLPLLTYRRLPNDDRETAGDHWLFDLLWRQPNQDMASGPWREGRVLHQINWGNGFSEIEWDNSRPELRRRALALWPIHPCRVTPVSGRFQADLYRQGYRYLVANNDGTKMPLRADEMLHVPGIFPEDGIWGKSAVEYHRETIGFGLATEEHGATFFGDGAQPAGILTTPGLKDPEARKQYRKEWKELHGSAGSAEIAILPPEAKFTPLTMSNENAQYLETRKFNVSQVARILRVPVYMLEEYEKAASYASVEARGIDFIVYTLMPWLRKWEEQIHLKLILPQDRDKIFVEHLLAGLLRGDFASRMAGYVQALGNGIMTINEVRRLENLNSIGPAGDRHYVQLNMTTAERMAEGEPQQRTATPFASEPADPNGEDDVAAVENLTRRVLANGRAVSADTFPVKADTVRLVLADAFGRALTKLANALKREAGKVTNLQAWLDVFLAEHGAALASALEPAAAVLCRGDVTGVSLWAVLAVRSGTDLAAAFNEQTPKQFAETLAEWPRTLAGTVADELLQEESHAR